VAGFFKEPQAAAVLKHGILKRYLPIFVTKTGSVAGEVVYLDCYAGPGLYSDGSDGSPALALATAKAVAGAKGRASMHGHLIEKEPRSVNGLRVLLATQGLTWDVHQGQAEEHVPRILQGLGDDVPMFAFIDPFGLPIPFDMVVDIMKRSSSRMGRYSSKGAATEVLMNFSKSGINRVGGQLTGTGSDPSWLKARATMIEKMDASLGGDWWQASWRSGDADRVDQIRETYAGRLRKAAGGQWACFDIGVSDRWQGPPAYQLLLLTQHVDGVWGFHEALSSAQEEYRAYCHMTQGLLDFEALPDRELMWVQNIEENVERLLRGGKPFKPVYKLQETFGDAFGEAREKHLRQALRNLRKAGKISIDPKGPLAQLEIKR